MKRLYLTLTVLSISLLVSVPASYAQGAAKTGPDPATIRDPELEKDSLHNLQVARNYFKLKKAYVASLKRCEEIIAGNPNFASIDEVLLIAGKSASLLADGRGKQKPELYKTFDGSTRKGLTPEEFRSGARSYLTQLINEHPQSSFRREAEAELQAVGGPIKTEGSKQ
jgi:outer membrane protein assembly factor BamD (BamD/ComL family)